MSTLTTTALPDGSTEYTLVDDEGTTRLTVVPPNGTMAPAKWKSVEDVPFDATDDLLTHWVIDQWTKGRQHGEAQLVKVTKTGVATTRKASLQFQQGASYADAMAMPFRTKAQREIKAEAVAMFELRTVITDALDRHHRRQEAYAAADRLIEHSQEASMQAEVEHYESDELAQARSVLERFGRFDPTTGEFHPTIVRRHEQDGKRLQETRSGTLPLDVVMPRVYRALNDKAKPTSQGGHQISRIDWVLSHEGGHRDARGFFQAEPGQPQIVFLSMTEGSAAYGRGEHAWAVWFQPTTYVMRERMSPEQRRRHHDHPVDSTDAAGNFIPAYPDMEKWELDSATGYPTDPVTGRIHSRLTGQPIVTEHGEFVLQTSPKRRNAWDSPTVPERGPIGWGGVLATYSNTTLAREAASDLGRALATIRRVDAERANPDDGTMEPDQDELVADRAPQFTPTPVL